MKQKLRKKSVCMVVWKSLQFFWLTLPSNENLLLTPISLLCERKTGTLFNSNIRSDVCCLCFTKKMNFYTFVDCKYVVGKKSKNNFGASSLVEKIIYIYSACLKIALLYLVIIFIMSKIIASKNCNKEFGKSIVAD